MMASSRSYPAGFRKPLAQRLRSFPRSNGRHEQAARGLWKALASAARLAAAAPESDDAAYELAGARREARGAAPRGMGGGGACAALVELTRDWPIQGLEARMTFAPAVTAAAELVERLAEQAALAEAAFARRACGSED